MKLSGLNLTYFESLPEDINSEAEKEFLDQDGKALELFKFLSEDERNFFNKLPSLESRKLFFKIIVDRIKNQKELMVDDMTGMFRREMMYRYLELKLDKKSDSELMDMPMTLTAADFAYLSYFNMASHDAGDIALSTAAETIKNQMKSAGAVSFRMGGDEFAFAIPKNLSKAVNVTLEAQEKLSQINTSDPKIMGGHKFEMPFWVDFGSATIGEGLEVWKKFCDESESKKYCSDEMRINQVIDFAFKIADGRSSVKKHHSLVKRLVEQMLRARAENSMEKYDAYFTNSTMKKSVTREQINEIADIKDVIERSRRISLVAQSMKNKEDDADVTDERIKINIIDSYIAENVDLLFE